MCYEELKKNFNSLSPATTFWLGLIGSVLVLCTVGFFVLLGLVMKGGFSGGVANTVKVTTGDTAPADDQQAGNKDALTVPVTGTIKPVTSRDHVLGSAGAKITLIEYSDFECPYCKNFDVVMQQVMKDYAGKVKWVYRHWPLSFHANAQKEAEASECAYELGGNTKFWQFADAIYKRTTANGTGFALTDLPKLAVELGLNQAKFETCLNGGKYKSYVEQQATDAQASGISGTPGLLIMGGKDGDQLVKGALPIDLMKQVIDKALE